MQGTRVGVLVWEDPTCHGATKPMHHNYWACALEPASHNYWAHVPQLLKPMRLEPVLRNKRSHCNEKPVHHNEEHPPFAATRESPHAATKTQHSQKKKKKVEGITTQYWGFLESDSNQDCVVLVKGQMHRSVEQNREPRRRPTQMWPTVFWQRFPSNSVEGESPFRHKVLEQLDLHKHCPSPHQTPRPISVYLTPWIKTD